MVTKEQRRGVVADINDLAEFVREEGFVDLGMVMIRFKWATAKAYAMIKAVSGVSHPDIERRGSNLFHAPLEEET